MYFYYDEDDWKQNAEREMKWTEEKYNEKKNRWRDLQIFKR